MSGPVVDAMGALLVETLMSKQRAVLESGRTVTPVIRATVEPDTKVIGADALAASLYVDLLDP